MWVRGLKSDIDGDLKTALCVAPRVGAWIEIMDVPKGFEVNVRRTPCGCVD